MAPTLVQFSSHMLVAVTFALASNAPQKTIHTISPANLASFPNITEAQPPVPPLDPPDIAVKPLPNVTVRPLNVTVPAPFPPAPEEPEPTATPDSSTPTPTPEPWVTTKVFKNATMMSNVVAVASAAGLEVGSELIVDPQGPHEERAVIAELREDDVLVLEEILNFPHAQGEVVEQVPGGPVALKSNLKGLKGKSSSTVYRTDKGLKRQFWLKAAGVAGVVAIFSYVVGTYFLTPK